MTFIPEVQTKTDTNNSYSSASSNSFTGTSTVTTGYNTIILTIQSSVNSSAGSIVVYMSENNSTWISFYTDTYIASNIYTKSFTITNKYWKLAYTASTTGTLYITSRLSTQLDTNSNTTNNITVFDGSVEASLDAFGKLRVTNPFTIIDLRFPSLSIASGANSTFLQNNQQICTKSINFTATFEKSKVIMGGTGVGYYMTQTRNYGVYQPGKSLLFMASAVLNPGNTNFTTRIGYFDCEFTTSATFPTVNNGLYFQISGGICSLHIKNVTDTSIIQSNWNIDKMDGSGPSGLNLDFTKAQLFVMDMEWLSVGRIRFGFYAYGQIRYCHQVTNINILTAPYTNTINLPISHQIICNTAGQTGSMKQICSTLISEGGYNPIGRPFSVSNGITTVTVPTSETALIAIRGGGVNYYHQNIIPTGITIIDTSSNNNLLYRLRIYLANDKPSSNNTASYTTYDLDRSVVEFATGSNIIGSGIFQTSNSIIIDQGYFYGRGTIAFNSLSDIFSSLLLQVTSNIDLTSDILVLTAQKIGTSTTPVLATISWQEIY